jgi:hypothetical protein
MSYSIYIGNTEMDPVEDEDYTEGYTTEHSRIVDGKVCYYDPVVRETHHPEAPTFPNDEMTGNSNGRHPSYSGWHGLFFNEKHGLMREHPGHQPLKSWHAEEIERACARWKEEHPDAQPGFEKFSWEDDAVEVGYDPILARLIWLDWWVKWALSHCEHPALYNY